MTKHREHLKDIYAIAIGVFILFVIVLLQKRPVIVEAPTQQKEIYSYIPQFVVLSFDGSKSLKMWKDTRAFARDMAASSTPVHFTYFINPVYFLTKEEKNLYHGPRHAVGETPIGFSNTAADVVERVNQVNGAYAEGHEIGSHAVGHFDGSTWSYDEWKQEFELFNTILFRKQFYFTAKDITGFRAPELGVNQNLFTLLSDKGFRYDASGVAKGDKWPYKDKRGLWRYPLGTIFLGENHRATIAMDYNIWLYQKENAQQSWTQNFEEVVEGYTDYFNKNYKGDRAPVIIGHHFSGWNDNTYWEAMKTFARDVCTRPEVKCVSFKELTDYLDEYGVPEKSVLPSSHPL